MSHADPGPLASYNSLMDPHLGGFFANTRMKKHLEKSGLVTKSGKIVSEKTYRLQMARKEHKDHVRDLLATAIVHKALDMERSRQHELRKRLDDIYKVELVKRVRNEREKKGDEDVMTLLTPRERVRKRSSRHRPHAPSHVLVPSEIGYDEERGRLFYNVFPSDTSTGDEMNSLISGSGYNQYYKPYPPATYPMPAPPPSRTPREGSRSKSAANACPKKNKLKLHRYTYLARSEPAVAHKVQLQSMAEVTMKFLGPKLHLKNDVFCDERLSEVMVLQQHCGGSTLCVFRELLPPNTIFTFISRRHRGSPFGLTMYVDTIQDIRLSSCCEYKHKPGHILGGKNGHFHFVNVEGAAPCYRCQIAFSVKQQRRLQNDRHKKSTNNCLHERTSSQALLTSTNQEQEKDLDEMNDVAERFEVTITAMNPRDGDSAIMVDTTTQTPRDNEVVESKGNEDDELKNVEEAKEVVEPAESTKDSGIIQDEHAYDESYDDDDFEEEDFDDDLIDQEETLRKAQRENEEVDKKETQADTREKDATEDKDETEQELQNDFHVEVVEDEAHEMSDEESQKSEHEFSSEEDSDKEEVERNDKDEDKLGSTSSSSDVEESGDEISRNDTKKDEVDFRKISESELQNVVDSEKNTAMDGLESVINNEEIVRSSIDNGKAHQKEQDKSKSDGDSENSDRNSENMLDSIKIKESKKPSSNEVEVLENDQSGEQQIPDETREKFNFQRDVFGASNSKHESENEDKLDDKSNVNEEKTSVLEKEGTPNFESESDNDSNSNSFSSISNDSDEKNPNIVENESNSSSDSKIDNKVLQGSNEDAVERDIVGSMRRNNGGEKRPGSAGSGILRGSNKTLDSILDDDSRPKKTVSFNKDVKVYAGDVIDEGNNGLGEHDRDKDVTVDRRPVDKLHLADFTEKENLKEEGLDGEVVLKEVERSRQKDAGEKSHTIDNALTEEEHNEKGNLNAGTQSEENVIKEKTTGEDTMKKEGQNREDVLDEHKSSGEENVKVGRPIGVGDMKEDDDTEEDILKAEETSSNNNLKEGHDQRESSVEKYMNSNEDKNGFESNDNKQEHENGTTEHSAAMLLSINDANGSNASLNETELTNIHKDLNHDLNPGNDFHFHKNEEAITERALKTVGLKPSVKHDGSIKELINSNNENDLELANVAMNYHQVEEVAKIVEKNPDVASLTLRNVSLGNDGIEQLTDVLKSCSSIKMLNLNVNNIGEEGARHIADVIRDNRAIKILLLHGNPLGDKGVTLIVDAILENKISSLSTLDVGDCGLANEGARQIARLLDSGNITDLNISANNITNDGWVAFGKALKSNKKLRSLSLDYNKITNEDLAVLAQGFQHCTSLRSVDLEANRIEDEGALLLLDVLRENKNILDLRLMPKNSIKPSIVDEIKSILDERVQSRPSSATSEDAAT
ncbi:glutamate-rich protein 3-like isoform X2 [Xenia sp. Carnegie-2017]|uniref:glutamate-rich protein 3-like isoform X2 n=1 Tax=Xenia sp. Carnegie-2017 TaxID=2897299 RepID=UPI001F03951A|nr:glutamate-rich protein 3-like isoform X2 [Xenia sp. Carnegie-2017]